jgi:hypothetical protein
MKESIMTNASQGVVRGDRGEEQPLDNDRAQAVVSVEEKARNEKEQKK